MSQECGDSNPVLPGCSHFTPIFPPPFLLLVSRPHRLTTPLDFCSRQARGICSISSQAIDYPIWSMWLLHKLLPAMGLSLTPTALGQEC